ncbi:MAG: hypothetical protein CFH06_01283 [Alphaproteobacteria bacterium MarineAlpha3_Bin5]|nr:hypothetical protein [Magnetovibrio sp.]PPR77414.1 MAG: hypothetical protein CFH06_01283 [Alphaproteobacteria bacterium MarineAlpha3_Bin5]
MDEEVFNIQVRKFLKNVGVTSQREIENSIRNAFSAGKLQGTESVAAKITLEIKSLDLTTEIDGNIRLR